MSVNSISLKHTVLGLGVAALVGGVALMGAPNTADASFICSNSTLNANQADKGTCWNAANTEGNAAGDFRDDAGWQTTFGSDWASLEFTTTGLLSSQFSTQKAFGAQSEANVASVLGGSDWFGTPMTLVDSDNISGGSFNISSPGNVIEFHVGGYNFAFLYSSATPFAFSLSGVAKDSLSNYRIYNTVSAVPLPAALPLFGAALLGMGYLGRRKKLKAVQSA